MGRAALLCGCLYLLMYLTLVKIARAVSLTTTSMQGQYVSLKLILSCMPCTSRSVPGVGVGVGARETTVLVAPRSCRLAGTACVLYSAARCPGRAQAAASLAPGTPPPDDQRGTARDTGRQREARVQPCANRSPSAPPQAHPGSRECPAWPRPAAVAVGRLRPGRRHSRQPSQKIQKPGRPALSSVLYLFFQFSTYSKSD